MQEEIVKLHIFSVFLLDKIAISRWTGAKITKLHKCLPYTNSHTSIPTANMAANTKAGTHNVP